MPLIAPPPFVVGRGGGSSDQIDVGSGLARPRGIESAMEFNGLALNDRRLMDTYIITQIDGLADPDVRDSRDVNPGRHGETAFNAYYGGRTIVLTGKVRAHTIHKLRDMQEALKQAFADISTEQRLVIGTENADTAVTIECRKSQPIVMAEVQQDLTYRRDFQITLRASNPRLLSVEQEWHWWASQGTMTPNQAEGILSFTNLGNWDAEPVIEIDGPVTAATPGGPALKLTAGVEINGRVVGQSFTINAKPGSLVAIPDGAHFVLDAARRTLVQVGSDRRKTNVFSQFDIDSEWPEFPPGSGVIELTAYGLSDPRVLVRFKHTYI